MTELSAFTGCDSRMTAVLDNIQKYTAIGKTETSALNVQSSADK